MVSLFCYTVLFLHLILFMYSLISIISFLQQILCFLSFHFSKALSFIVRVLEIYLLFKFSAYTFIIINFPPVTASAILFQFWYLVSAFSIVFKNSYFPFNFFHCLFVYLGVCYLTSMYLCSFHFSTSCWFVVLIHCNVRKYKKQFHFLKFIASRL